MKPPTDDLGLFLRPDADRVGTHVIDSALKTLGGMAESSIFSSAGAGLDLVDASLEILGRRFLVAVHLHAAKHHADKEEHVTNYETYLQDGVVHRW